MQKEKMRSKNKRGRKYDEKNAGRLVQKKKS
jgi:hypothetical protein